MIITLKIQQFQELYGYFDLVVDTSEVNLAVRYTVTATNATKPCTVETGATLNIPLFVNTGDMITIDTRTGEYTGRA